ncbi:MAG: hypothetical protein IKY33_00315 [Clostridia bacterium]|nr:hypothetical protein [Clostridia bacterium]
MKQLLGNQHLIAQIRTAVREDKAAHAYLICGAVGSGKKTLADIISTMLMCPEGGCEQCVCCQKVEKGIHPDLIRLRGDNKNGTYSVDQIREIRKDALVYPNEGRKKIYVLEEAEKMSPAAQDAFLKILEEPPAFVVFLLLCSDESRMLATVLSRVIRLALELPSTEQSLSWLREQAQAPDDLIRTALGAAGGNPGQALSLIKEGKLKERIANCEAFSRALLTGTAYDMAAISHKLAADKEEFAEFIKTLALYFRDIAVYKTAPTAELVFADSIASLAGYFVRIRADGLLRTIEGLQQLAVQVTQSISILLLEMRLVTLVRTNCI